MNYFMWIALLLTLLLIWTSFQKQTINKKSEKIGVAGENKIARLLSNENGYVLQNLYIPTGNGRTTELDLVFISAKGIFVIESKNYNGEITGKVSDKDWRVRYANGKSFTLYNPIMQNEGHIRALRNVKWWFGIPIHSVIMFGDGANIDGVMHLGNVMKVKDLIGYVQNIQTRTTIPEKKVVRIHNQLKCYTDVSGAAKRNHVKNVKRAKKRRN